MAHSRRQPVVAGDSATLPAGPVATPVTDGGIMTASGAIVVERNPSTGAGHSPAARRTPTAHHGRLLARVV